MSLLWASIRIYFFLVRSAKYQSIRYSANIKSPYHIPVQEKRTLLHLGDLVIISSRKARVAIDASEYIFRLYQRSMFIYISTEIAHWTIVVYSVQDASTRQNTPIIMSVSSLPNKRAGVAIVAMKRPGDILFNVHITPQQGHKTRKTLLHVSYSCLCRTTYPQHPITLSV